MVPRFWRNVSHSRYLTFRFRFFDGRSIRMYLGTSKASHCLGRRTRLRSGASPRASSPCPCALTEECGAAVVRKNVRAVWWCVHLTPRRTLSAVPCALLSFAIKRSEFVLVARGTNSHSPSVQRHALTLFLARSGKNVRTGRGAPRYCIAHSSSGRDRASGGRG